MSPEAQAVIDTLKTNPGTVLRTVTTYDKGDVLQVASEYRGDWSGVYVVDQREYPMVLQELLDGRVVAVNNAGYYELVK